MATSKTRLRLLGSSVGIQKEPGFPANINRAAERKTEFFPLVGTTVHWMLLYTNEFNPYRIRLKKKNLFLLPPPQLLLFCSPSLKKTCLHSHLFTFQSIAIRFHSSIQYVGCSDNRSQWPINWHITRIFLLSSFYVSCLRHWRLEWTPQNNLFSQTVTCFLISVLNSFPYLEGSCSSA